VNSSVALTRDHRAFDFRWPYPLQTKSFDRIEKLLVLGRYAGNHENFVVVAMPASLVQAENLVNG
jgi:hypothetical protein